MCACTPPARTVRFCGRGACLPPQPARPLMDIVEALLEAMEAVAVLRARRATATELLVDTSGAFEAATRRHDTLQDELARTLAQQAAERAERGTLIARQMAKGDA